MDEVNRTALARFDDLPDSAFSRVPVVAAVFGISVSATSGGWRGKAAFRCQGS